MTNMKLARWDPFRELEEMSARLGRLFGDSVSRNTGREAMFQPDRLPAVDIAETKEGFEIKVELPDVKKKDVRVSIENGILTIQGERNQAREEHGKRFHRIERSYGTFMRSFAMPDNVDEAKVRAE